MNADIKSRLGIAIVGCGEQGQINARAAQAAREVTLVMVMDASGTVAQACGERLAVPATARFEEVLANPKVDIIFINTPHHLHRELAVRAVGAGKHVIVEKPLATTLADAVEMVEAARLAKVRLSMWLGKRYSPAVAKAHRLVRQGLLGDRVLGASLVFHNHKTPAYWQGGFSGKSTDWRGRWADSGGGVFIMTGIHFLDWITYLTGERIVELSAKYATLASPVEVEDTLTMWYRFERGGLGTANFSSCVRGGRSDILELRIYGTEGQVSLTDPPQFYSTRILDDKPPERWHLLEAGPAPSSEQVQFLDGFGASIRQGTEFEISAREAVELQALCETAYASAREGRALPVQYPVLA